MTKRNTRVTAAAFALAAATCLGGVQLATAHHEFDPNAPPSPVQPLGALQDSNWAITHWVKQTVYDMGDNKIGDIKDVLLDHDGKASAVIIGVGGFLGLGEKSVAVPYASVHFKSKDQKWYPVMNTTKDALGTAQEFKYDQDTMKWMPQVPTTEGRSTTPPKK
jgi:hypothetical protein